MLIGMGGGSLSKELYDWFGYTPSTATASAFVQQRNKIRSKAIEMIFNEFVASAMPTMTFRGYRLFAVDGRGKGEERPYPNAAGLVTWGLDRSS